MITIIGPVFIVQFALFVYATGLNVFKYEPPRMKVIKALMLLVLGLPLALGGLIWVSLRALLINKWYDDYRFLWWIT